MMLNIVSVLCSVAATCVALMAAYEAGKANGMKMLYGVIRTIDPDLYMQIGKVLYETGKANGMEAANRLDAMFGHVDDDEKDCADSHCSEDDPDGACSDADHDEID